MRFYLMPMVGAGTGEDPRRCKYADDITAAGLAYAIVDYGPEDLAIVRINPNPSAALHSAMTSDVTVSAFPQNLDNQINGALATVQARLDSVGVPSDWVDATTTYRQLLRRMVKYFMVMQYTAAFAGDYVSRLFANGRTLSTTINVLPAAIRNRLSDAADAMGLDRTGLSGASTLRQVLRKIAEQLPDSDGFV